MSDLFDLPFEEEDEPPDLEGPACIPSEPAAPARVRKADLSDPPAPATTPAAARRILSVSDLTVRIRDLLEGELFEVWVEGELSNCRIWNTGHLYFTLKDSSSQLRGLMFRSALRYLKFKPEDGQRVVARGRVSAYEPTGEYPLVCEHPAPP